MENMLFFIGTFLIWFCLWKIVFGRNSELRTNIAAFVVVALLCVPFNVGGNVVTILGNGVSEKNILSVFPIYQKAENGEAVALFGLMLEQKASKSSTMLLGVVVNQEAGSYYPENAVILAGVAGRQAATGTAAVGIGLVGHQKSEISAAMGMGIGLLQEIPGEKRTFGIFSALEAEEAS